MHSFSLQIEILCKLLLLISNMLIQIVFDFISLLLKLLRFLYCIEARKSWYRKCNKIMLCYIYLFQ